MYHKKCAHVVDQLVNQLATEIGLWHAITENKHLDVRT